MLTDPIADMLTRIRNANRALHDSASMPTSRMKEEIARILKDEGYIADYRVVETKDGKDEPLPYKTLVVELKFARDRRREGSASTCPRRSGDGNHVHLERCDHQPPGRRARRRRRSDRLRLVEGAPERCRESAGNRSNCLPG